MGIRCRSIPVSTVLTGNGSDISECLRNQGVDFESPNQIGSLSNDDDDDVEDNA